MVGEGGGEAKEKFLEPYSTQNGSIMVRTTDVFETVQP